MRGRLVALGTLTAWALACSGDGGTPPPDPPPPGQTTVALDIVGGADQRAPITTELPLPIAVRVMRVPVAAMGGTAAFIDPVPVTGQLVNFVVAGNDAKVFAGSALTDSLGRAQERVTCGTQATAGTVEARAVDAATGAPIVFDRAAFTCDAGPAATITLVSSDTTVYLGTPLTVASLVTSVVDAHGNVIANPALTATAPAPATVSGGAISFPSELRAAITINSGPASAPITVTAVVSPTSLVGYHGVFTCDGTGEGSMFDGDPHGSPLHYALHSDGTLVLDSIVTTVIMPPGGPVTVWQGWFTRAISTTYDWGARPVFSVATPLYLIRQRPDTLSFFNGNQTYRFIRNGVAYRGESSWCSWGQNWGPLTNWSFPSFGA